MKVRELIELLQDLDPEKEIIIPIKDGSCAQGCCISYDDYTPWYTEDRKDKVVLEIQYSGR